MWKMSIANNDSEMKTFRPKVSTQCESFQPGSDQEAPREDIRAPVTENLHRRPPPQAFTYRFTTM